MSFASQFLQFVDASPSPFHAVETASKRLLEHGFVEVAESASWTHVKPGGK
jgi:aspartyl aminopeptidase